MSKKICLIILTMITIVMLIAPATALAETGIRTDEIQSGLDEGSLGEAVDEIAGSIATLLRHAALPLGVVFIIWAAYLIWWGPDDPESRARAKSRFVKFAAVFFLIFSAERILGYLIELFGLGDMIHF